MNEYRILQIGYEQMRERAEKAEADRDRLREALREVLPRWREDSHGFRQSGFEECADELEAALEDSKCSECDGVGTVLHDDHHVDEHLTCNHCKGSGQLSRKEDR